MLTLKTSVCYFQNFILDDKSNIFYFKIMNHHHGFNLSVGNISEFIVVKIRDSTFYNEIRLITIKEHSCITCVI